MKKEEIVHSLQGTVLFGEVGQADLENYAEICRVQIVPEGDYVYRQGDDSEVFYVIALGEVELIREREDGVSRVVGRIAQGGHFGETGIFTGKPRSVSIKALFDVVVICFDKRVFRATLLANNLIHQQLDAALAERLRVAFLDQADTVDQKNSTNGSSVDDVILFKNRNFCHLTLPHLEKGRQNHILESRTAKKTQEVITAFAANDAPYLLTGDAGTGKGIIGRQIHSVSSRAEGNYEEIDLRGQDPIQLNKKLFGKEQSNFPFAQARQDSIFERCYGGTIVFAHIHLMGEDLQRKLIRAIESNTYCPVDSERPIAMQSRMVFISTYDLDYLENSGKILPELLAILRRQYFHVPSLREHKRDLPRLIEHYLDRFSKEYGKNIKRVSPETLGLLMNYDWPGNLAELSSVIRRAVILASKDEILSDQILLGLPKTEGKWEFNLLRIPFFTRFLQSKTFPAVPQAVVAVFLLVAVLALFLGPPDPEKNLGLVLSWAIGWPLLFCSFFFLARIWCSVCTLALPGKLLQHLVKPKRKTPRIIKNYSGWIMAIFCIVVLWIEIVWSAYRNPLLTGWIILTIATCSSIFSVLFSRRSWCRYFCPLGAINAIFSMPSILELRSNRHVCMNRCREHKCFGGDDDKGGCPMFRHPYLVDNNRDCIVCCDCIKHCDNSSIQVNLRLAPQELWDLQTPRRADSFLIVSLGAIFFPFALHGEFARVADWLTSSVAFSGQQLPASLGRSVVFFLVILIFQLGYWLMVRIQARHGGMDRTFLLPMLGYGFIPLILGGYLAVYFELFVSGAWRIVPIVQEMLGVAPITGISRLISEDSTYVLQVLTVLGGLLASMYATYRIIDRVLADREVTSRSLTIPYSFLVILAALFLAMV